MKACHVCTSYIRNKCMNKQENGSPNTNNSHIATCPYMHPTTTSTFNRSMSPQCWISPLFTIERKCPVCHLSQHSTKTKIWVLIYLKMQRPKWYIANSYSLLLKFRSVAMFLLLQHIGCLWNSCRKQCQESSCYISEDTAAKMRAVFPLQRPTREGWRARRVALTRSSVERPPPRSV